MTGSLLDNWRVLALRDGTCVLSGTWIGPYSSEPIYIGQRSMRFAHGNIIYQRVKTPYTQTEVYVKFGDPSPAMLEAMARAGVSYEKGGAAKLIGKILNHRLLMEID